jgi:valyl-tRNA synthetase
MDKSFNPQDIEARWYPRWEQSGAFAPSGHGQPYCIQLPPPNVTGTLHMGHAFQQTLMDLLIRWNRMQGRDTLWQCGTDHAGIATQKIVENQLAAQGQTRHDLGREAFIARVWDWKAESGSTITRQMRRIGASCDWSRERFTMDPGLSAAVRRVFVQWYRDGLIYRGKRLVHWDPVLGTAVSDLEVENVEKEGSLWSIRYPAADGGEGVVVATTRPETLLGDVAVAVHPEDERYRHLIGQQLTLPLTGRTIPVIGDDWVDREFGTGCVKITPAHDFNDFAMGQRHGLAPISIFTLQATVNDAAPEAYRGLDRFEARKRVLADLEAQGLLIATQKHTLKLPISQRSDAVTEPMLTDQWFVDLTRDTLPDGRPGGRRAITEVALAAVREGHIRFVPENWSTTYFNWLEGIQDWCISRQLWWGHRIPAWHDEAGNLYVGEDEADAIAHAATPPVGALTQDPDVLDTWFSSALWPFSTLGWPGDTPERAAEWQAFQRFVPSDVLVTGFDIIFFWVARMVMATTYFVGREPDGRYAAPYDQLAARVPFREVYINAIVRDAEGQKMAKSKGNTLDPIDLIDGIELDALLAKSTRSLLIPQVREKVEKRIRRDYPTGIQAVGTDAMRFTFAALATHGRTINFDLKRCEGYKNFCNKLWNAARFVLMNLPEAGSGAPPAAAPDIAGRWIAHELHGVILAVQQHIADYRFDLAAQALYDFVWNEYCDWYVELCKPALQGEPAARAAAQAQLLKVLDAILRLMHPITPFITEEIHAALRPHLPAGTPELLLTRTMPQAAEFATDPEAAAEIGWLKQVLSGLRRIRSENNVAPSRSITLTWRGGDALDAERLHRHLPAICVLARVEQAEALAEGADEPLAAPALVGGLKLLVPLAGLIDLDAERARLDRELAKLEAELAKCAKKLGTDSFVNAAPAAVVAQERQRQADFLARQAELSALRARIG